MDVIEDERDALDGAMSTLLRSLIDQDLSVVFYDLATVGAEGATKLAGDLRAAGRAKSGLIERQFVLSYRAMLAPRTLRANREGLLVAKNSLTPFQVSGPALTLLVSDGPRHLLLTAPRSSRDQNVQQYGRRLHFPWKPSRQLGYGDD